MMKIALTSDVHILNENCGGAKFLKSFFKNSSVKKADVVIFLGDIFDIMIGPKKEYKKKYKFFFDGIDELLSLGIKIYYIEGNHDFHLKGLFRDEVELIQGALILESSGKKFYFFHGDDLDLFNKSYKRWKRFYSSKFMGFLLKYVIPYALINYLGILASSTSKKIDSKIFDTQKERNKYRENFKIFDKNKADVFISGHTHIQDEFHFEGKTFFNNGFPQSHGLITYIEDGIIKRIPSTAKES